MISVCDIAVEFGALPLFEDVSFVVNKKDRIALVGKNGAGKSTLLKIINKQLTAFTGTVRINNINISIKLINGNKTIIQTIVVITA